VKGVKSLLIVYKEPMSRPPRIEHENAVYHVMNRGRGRKVIFHGREYFAAFLQGLSEANQRFGVEILDFCIMSNHYHAVVHVAHERADSKARRYSIRWSY
jgi:REP element-mobilizing transposase RayT